MGTLTGPVQKLHAAALAKKAKNLKKPVIPALKSRLMAKKRLSTFRLPLGQALRQTDPRSALTSTTECTSQPLKSSIRPNSSERTILEANKYAFKAVGHACDAPDASGKYHNCDRSGQCSIDVLTNNLQKDYGPGFANTINTMKAFSVETIFHESAGFFTGYTTVLEQDGKQVVLKSSNCSYLSRMTTDMTDMVLVISNWGSGNLDWLQHGVCSGTCSRSGTFSAISDFQITTGSN